MTTTEGFSAEPAGAHTMAAEDGAREGRDSSSAPGPRVDAGHLAGSIATGLLKGIESILEVPNRGAGGLDDAAQGSGQHVSDVSPTDLLQEPELLGDEDLDVPGEAINDPSIISHEDSSARGAASTAPVSNVEAGARGGQVSPQPSGPRADARNIQIYGNAGAGFTAQRRNPDGTWEVNRELPTMDDAYAWARSLTALAQRAGHMVEPDDEGHGWRAWRMLCDGTWGTRAGFSSRDEAHRWATQPAPGTALEGTTTAIRVDTVQAGIIASDVRAAWDYYERLVGIFEAQDRTDQVRLARRVLLAMTALEASL